MLTYELKKSPGVPLYEALYRCIREDILSGALAADEKLPSKRALAQNLEVSKITVEAAYNQLLAEGFIRSQEKVGYFVEKVEHRAPGIPAENPDPQPKKQEYLLDLTANGTEHFPFSVWSRLQREVMLDYGEKLLLPLPNQGIPELRQAIAHHLAAFRGMHVDPENILIGAGTDFLYNLLIQLLGRDKVYAVEEASDVLYAELADGSLSVTIDKSPVIEYMHTLNQEPSEYYVEETKTLYSAIAEACNLEFRLLYYKENGAASFTFTCGKSRGNNVKEIASKLVLDLGPSNGNPRNSEGAFIRKEDGTILFAYSRYSGRDWHDHQPSDIALVRSVDEVKEILNQ